MSDETKPLIVRDDRALSIAFTPEAETMRAEAVECASMIVKVDSVKSQELAVDAQKSCRRVIKLVEDSRKDAKAPVIAFGKAIDDAAKKFVREVEIEELRIARMVGNFQQAELARARSAEAARIREITEAEKAREEALAKAQTLEQRENIREEFSQVVAAVQVPLPTPARVEGQRVEEVWEFEVTNPHLLANSHPLLVKIEPRRREIIEALKSGMTVHGITARKEIRASVRLDREQKAIAA